MPAHVSEPQVVPGSYPVTHPQYMNQVLSRLPKRERTSSHARKAQIMTNNLGVDTQYLSRPLESPVVAGGGLAGEHAAANNEDALKKRAVERAAATRTDALKMGAAAVELALAKSGVDRGDINAIVVSHVTGWGSPGLASRIREECQLNPDIDKNEMNSVACAGGAAALARAFDYVTAYPDRKVLVVVAERLSTIIHGDHTDLMDITYGRSFSDSGAACIVSGYSEENRKHLGPGMVITHRYEYEMPGTLDVYRGAEDHRGKEFKSDKRAPGATRDIIPEVLLWMKREGIAHPEWAALHPGSERIVQVMTEGFSFDPTLAANSLASLREGNKGGAAVLDVFARLFAAPPAHGAPGILVGVGPGVNVVTCAGYFVRG